MGLKDQCTTVDEVLQREIGELGWAQLSTLAVGGLCFLHTSMTVFLMTFTNTDPVVQRAWRCMDPHDAACMRMWNDNAGDNPAFCALAPSQYQWTGASHSLVSQYSLVCARAWMLSLQETVFFIGFMLGNGVCGKLADMFGRQRTIVIATAVTVTTSLVSVIPGLGFWPHLMFRAMSGLAAAGVSLAGIVLVTELTGPSWRGRVSMLTQTWYIFGEMLLVLLSLLFSSWRGLTTAVALSGLLVLAAALLVPESPRWLLLQGRVQQAEASLRWAARLNNRRLLSQLRQAGPDAAAKEQSVMKVLTHPLFGQHFLAICYVLFSLAVAYYGINLALGSLAGSLQLNFLLTALAELPSYLLIAALVDRLGRRSVVVAGTLTSAVACIGCACVPSGVLQVLLAMAGKFGCSSAWALGITFASELFPTVVRSGVLGLVSQSADLGSIVTPFLLLIGHHWHFDKLPFLVMGITSLAAAMFVSSLPETCGMPQPDTFQDLEVLLAAQKGQRPWFARRLWHWLRRKQGSPISTEPSEKEPTDNQGWLVSNMKAGSSSSDIAPVVAMAVATVASKDCRGLALQACALNNVPGHCAAPASAQQACTVAGHQFTPGDAGFLGCSSAQPHTCAHDGHIDMPALQLETQPLLPKGLGPGSS